MLFRYLACCMLLAGSALAQGSGPDEGIPVTDPVVIAKCGTCHARDERGNMQRISSARSTPEGWQDVVKRMVISKGVSLTPAEALTIVKYLSAQHGLAPAESKPVMYYFERRVREDTTPDDPLHASCAKCHSIARALSWRRSAADWKLYADTHAAVWKFHASEVAVAVLAKVAPLHTPEWDAWSARSDTADFSGRWLVTASLPGRGKYFGEMRLTRDAGGDFSTRVSLTSVNDGSRMVRTGRTAIYGDSAWRGRSSGNPPASADPGDPANEVREVMWIAPDHRTAEGRWFWGRYQEFGFDVRLQRPVAAPTLMLTDRSSLKTGTTGTRIRLIGDNLPQALTSADLTLGAGVTVRSIVSHSGNEVVAEVDVAAGAVPGKRDIALGGSVLPGALAIYDRIDYLKVIPQSAMASFSDASHPRGYQQFEAIGYQNGPDGKAHTDDDLDLGPVDATWSLQVFHAPPESKPDYVGTVSSAGLFLPGPVNPNSNFDVWVIATAKDSPLTDKSYMVVTVPTYIFNGRKFVRDLDRWVDDGSATGDN